MLKWRGMKAENRRPKLESKIQKTPTRPPALLPRLERLVGAFTKLSCGEQRQFANAISQGVTGSRPTSAFSDGGKTNPKLANPSKQSRGAYQAPATSQFGNPSPDEEDYFRQERDRRIRYAAEPDPTVTPGRVTLSVRMRSNPLRGLDYERMATYLDQWRLGFYRMAGMAWETMERRDYQLQIVRTKRMKSVARHGYDVLIRGDIAAAQQALAQAQRDFLNQFYANVTVTTAINPDEEGGFSLLARQMMDAIGKYYAVHEIVWQPVVDRAEGENRTEGAVGGPPIEGSEEENGGPPTPGATARQTGQMGLTAKFIFCPVWWFEGTRGKLRFLPSEFQIYGNEMEAGEWMVTCGDGLMESCSILYQMKVMLLKYNLAFLEKFGQPGIHGETDAVRGSSEWNDFVEAVHEFGQEWAAVTNSGTKINLIESKSSGDGGYQKLLEVFDRAITQLWRGSDLGTRSSQHAIGASLQEDESEILETDDARMIEETLDAKVTKYALAWKFGPETPRLAYIKLRTTPRRDLQSDIAVDTFLAGFTDKNGRGLLGVQTTLERYARPLPGPEEDTMKGE